MKLFKRGDAYYMDFTRDGRRYQRSTGHTDKREAKDFADKTLAKLINEGAGFLERDVPTLREYADTFKKHGMKKAKPNTVKFYDQQMSTLLSYKPFAEAKLDRIDEALIDNFIEWRSQQHRACDSERPQAQKRQVSPATVNRSLTTLRRLLRFAQSRRVIDRLPRFELLSGEHNREFVLSREEEARYLAAAAQPLQDVALLILDSGLRLGEALNLRWSDIHFQPVKGSRFGYLFVREGKSKNAMRHVPLSSRAVAMLRIRKQFNNSTLVFPSDDTKPGEEAKRILPSTLDHMHTRLRKQLGLPSEFVIHGLRHTMLTRMGERGVDAYTIMRIAGHSSIAISQRYVHPSRVAVEDAFDRQEVELRALPQLEESTTSDRDVPENHAKAAKALTGATDFSDAQVQ